MTSGPETMLRRLAGRGESLLKTILARSLTLVLPSGGRTALDPAGIRTILVVRQHDQLGDMLCAVPLLRALRERFPSCKITLVCSPVNYEIMRFHPHLSRTLLYDKKHFSAADYVKFVRGLREAGFDLAIVPCTVSISLSSNLLALLSGAPLRIGPGSLGGEVNPGSSCFTHKVDLDWRENPHRHQTLRNMDILAPVSASTDDLTVCIGLTAEETASAGERIGRMRGDRRIVVGIHPGAGKAGNRWGAENFARLADRAHLELGAAIVVTAGPMDSGPVDEFRRHCRVPFHLVDNEPIRSVAALINEMHLFIANDTGVLHVAGAVRADVLALFGPTDAAQWAPPGRKNRTILAPDGTMGSISPDAVFRNARDILAEK